MALLAPLAPPLKVGGGVVSSLYTLVADGLIRRHYEMDGQPASAASEASEQVARVL
jgi:hypothetical protein